MMTEIVSSSITLISGLLNCRGEIARGKGEERERERERVHKLASL